MSINVSSDITTITVESAANTITVVDTANKVSVIASQPVTQVVKVVAAGPRGLQGEQGPQGIQGPSGSQGPQGPPGSGTTINTGSFATTGSNTFTGSQVAPSFTSDQLTANDRAYLRRISGISGSTISILSYMSSSYAITAREFNGDGRYLDNLSATTNWNYNQEYTIKKTEQLTFSGDYVLHNTYLLIEGGTEVIEYSPNKYFKKEGTIYIGGNLLVKDSLIENNGKLSVGGEVILIGNSQIVGTGTII